MTSVAMSSSSITYTLAVIDSTGKTSKFRLVSPEVSIGRSEDNDIVVNSDPKISRHQAKLSLGQFGYEIHDLSDKNPVYVNGAQVKKAPLVHNSHIKIGSTEFVFEIQHPMPTSPSSNLAPTERGSVPGQLPNFRVETRKRKSKNSLTFKLLVLAIAGFFIWIFFSDNQKKKSGIGITSEQDIEANIEAAKQLKEAVENEKKEKSQNTLQFKQAQSAYIRGFRDYEKGLYDRSREAFQTCLSLYPEHALCTRYLNLSNKKFNELVQYHMILGTDYKDRNQYKSCMNSFRTVIVMVKNKNSKIYQQAKANYDACEAQLGQRF